MKGYLGCAAAVAFAALCVPQASAQVGTWYCVSGKSYTTISTWNIYPNGSLDVSTPLNPDGVEMERGNWSWQGGLLVTTFYSSVGCFDHGKKCVNTPPRPMWTFRPSGNELVLTFGQTTCHR